MPEERKYTATQEQHIKDAENVNLILDRTSSFSIRAPEFVPFNEVLIYLKYFSRKKNSKKDEENYDVDRVDVMPINDGMGFRTLLVQEYINEARNYLEEKLSKCLIFPNGENLNFGQWFVGNQLLNQILIPLCNMTAEEQKESELGKKFVDFSCKKPSIIVCTPISPHSPYFTYSRLLSYGKFTCELDVFNASDMRSAFLETKIIEEFSQINADAIIVKYWIEELFYLPIARGVLEGYIHESNAVIENLVLNGVDMGHSIPFILLKQIENFYNEEFNTMVVERDMNLIDVLTRIGYPHFPDEESLRNRRPNSSIVWNPLIPQPGPDQSTESFDEQNQVINNCKGIIEKLFNKDNYIHPNSILLAGSPGVGKTWVMGILATYALTLNLNICVTALTAQRARELGGVHLHELFCLRPNDHITISTELQSEKSILRLILQNPLKLEYLRRLDLLFIDEIGLLGREFISVLDNVLKSIRKSSIVFGGLMIIATGDYCQLAPVSGSEIWFSFYIFVSFKVFQLKKMVRSSNDENLQKIIQVLREAEISEDDKEIVLGIFKQLLMQDGKIVESFEKVPEEYVKLLSKKRGVKAALESVNIKREKTVSEKNVMKHPPQLLIEIAKFQSNDEMETNLGNYIPASAAVTKNLNRIISEPEILTITIDQMLRFTVNTNNYSQGQVCRVNKIFYNDGLPEAIEVTIAKPGTMEIDVTCKRMKIKPIYTRAVDLKRPWVKARRKQLPLDNAEVSTIHKAIGQTHTNVATRISMNDEMYSLWERPMFLVIVSRVRRLDDLMFVGEKNDTLKCIENVLNMKCEKWSRIERMFAAKDCRNEMITYEVFNGHAEDFYLPGIHTSGYIYILVSLKNKNEKYVDYTKNLREDLNEINMGVKDIKKSSALKPWVVMAFVPDVEIDNIKENSTENYESLLYHNIRGASSYYQSGEFYGRLQEIARDWNERIEIPFPVRLVWCCGQDWFRN